jgi:hypothetical protein
MKDEKDLLNSEELAEGDQKPEGGDQADDTAKKPEPSPVAAPAAPKKATDEELEEGLKDFLGNPDVSDDEKIATQKGFNRLTEQAKAARETARLEAEAERTRAKQDAEKIKADALKEAQDISNVAIAKKMVKSGKWTKEQAKEFMEEEGVDQDFDQDKLLTRVSEVVADTVARTREADRKAAENARIAEEKPKWIKAARDIEASCPRLNLQEIGYFLGKQYTAGVKPDEAVKAITERFGTKAPPTPPKPKKEGDELPRDEAEMERLANEDKAKYIRQT